MTGRLVQRRNMKQETIGNVEFTTDGERLTLRYTRQFTRRVAFILLLITLLAVVLLIYPIREFFRGNWGALPPGLFLLTLRGFVTWAVVSVWLHLSMFSLRSIDFDRGAGTSTIPRCFRRALVLPLSEIQSVLLRRTRKDLGGSSGIDYAGPSAFQSERNSIFLVMRGSPKRH